MTQGVCRPARLGVVVNGALNTPLCDVVSTTVLLLAKQLAVVRAYGFRGMYQGMQAKLLQTVLTSALLFLGYEKLLQVTAVS